MYTSDRAFAMNVSFREASRIDKFSRKSLPVHSLTAIRLKLIMVNRKRY